MASATCPICRTSLRGVPTRISGGSLEAYDCSRCRRFVAPDDLGDDLARAGWTDEERAVLSHAVARANFGSKRPFLLDGDFLSDVRRERSLPTAAEQADNLVFLVGLETTPGRRTFVDESIVGGYVGATLGAEGVLYLVDGLYKEGLLGWNSSSPTAGLTFDGWRRFEELRRRRVDSRRAFMAMPYGDDTLDEVFRSCFVPAVEAAGFKLERLDDNPQPGLIDNRLRVEIRTARFLVADLTTHNRGAYWEAGFAEGLDRPVIYTCRRDVVERKQTHFDTEHQQIVLWEPDKLEKARAEITAMVRVALPGEATMPDAKGASSPSEKR
jgi:hypothetical protein